MSEVKDFLKITFDGEYEKTVKDGELFCSDPIMMSLEKEKLEKWDKEKGKWN